MSAQTSSSQAPEADLPELSAALHQAAERALTPLLDTDHLVGRVRRKRRTRAVVAAGLAAVLLAVGALAAPHLLTAKPDPANRTHKPRLALADVTEARMISWFASTLPPGGRISGASGLGMGQKPPADQIDTGQYVANAVFVYDNGHSAGRLNVFVQRWDANGVTKMPPGCATGKTNPGYSCTQTDVAGGGRLSLVQGGIQVPMQSVPMVDLSACLMFRSGGQVCVGEMNQTDLSTFPTHRDVPLTLAQLRASVTAPIWQQILAAIPKQGKLVPKSPSIEKVMAGLLPAGYAHTPVVRAKTKWELGYGSVLTGPQGKGSVFEDSVYNGMKASDSLAEFHQTYPHAVKLPDGDWLGESRLSGESGRGVVWNQAAVIHGTLWITMVALNSVDVSGPPTLSSPVLTLDQLATIAENPVWRQAMWG
ncbi:hypothetical protein [Streptacidiphilus jiangxiensis]|uniref:Uncharacterized protein n=1 Tax=Streptacidiphilus jiangxiensis TaxID=235985 RepID=A0A1H7IXD9_STRJI|nr:hypothetical protein [Streptacidiphilus jiangxiensis]SEK67203.1 hypothetical protein SAMN05414137_10360 [Streptacidiphilus jiangxiensis]